MSFFEYALSEPDRPAIVGSDRSISFSELDAHASRMAALLDDFGVGAGDSVAVLLPNEWEYIAIELACLSTGRYIVPVNRYLTSPEIAYILGNCTPSVLFTNEKMLPTALDAAAQSGVLSADRVLATGGGSAHDITEQWSKQSADRPVNRTAGSVMFYSSGTTGKPKGIKRALSGVAPEIEAAAGRESLALLNLQDGPGVHLVIAPLYHSAPNAMAIAALNRGVTLAIPQLGSFDAETFLQNAAHFGMTESFMVPTMFQRLARLPEDIKNKYDVSAIINVIHAGAPCPVPVKHAMIQWWGPVLEEFYGSTESSIATIVHSDEWLQAPGTVGRARPGYEIQIRAADGSIQAPGQEGLIFCGGSLPFEYVADPDKTAATWDANYLIIGDVGVLDDEGRLFVLDRRTDMILSGGVNIYPAEIEFTLVDHPDIIDAVVIGVPNEEWGQLVTAIVQPAEGVDRTRLSDSLLKFCEGRLAKYKRPSTIEIVDELPRMATGKINRSKIRNAYLADGAPASR
ncbi:MAG: AMP-binding protein [Antricoccus sp.]